MREILFRGKRIDNGEWIEGSSINTQYDVSGKKHVYIGFSVISEMYPLMQTIEWIEVIPETVGQYTGLTDKNGKKIFEGDILKGKHNWHNWNTSFGNDEKVFFEQKIRGAYGKHKIEEEEEYAMFDKDRYFYFRNYVVEYYAKNGGYRVRNGGQFHALTQTYIYNRDIEVIGNIHDNPELLKGEEEDA